MIGSMQRQYLPDVMRHRADKDRLPADHPVRIAANDMESVVIDRRSSLLEIRHAALAARRIWRRYSGDPLYSSEGG